MRLASCGKTDGDDEDLAGVEEEPGVGRVEGGDHDEGERSETRGGVRGRLGLLGGVVSAAIWLGARRHHHLVCACMQGELN